jgi:serine/threonine-protein kinase HipA
MVMGEGQNPSSQHLVKLGMEANLNRSQIDSIIDQTKYALNRWEVLAENHGVSKANIKLIQGRLLT